MVTSGFAKWVGVGAAALLPVLAAAPAAAGDTAPLPRADGYAAPRQEMVRVIDRIAGDTPLSPGRRAVSPGVLKVMTEVPRHVFVPEALRGRAYDDRPLPIGYGQTISQPYIVALMTDLLEVDGDDVAPGFAYFHRAKSCGSRLRSSTSTRAPASSSSRFLPDRRP